MNNLKRWLVVVFCCVITVSGGAATEEKPIPTMPSEVTLTSGRVLRNVKVIRWESNRVVLKYTGGVDPIAFSIIKVPGKEEIAAMAAADQERIKLLKIETAKLEQMKRQAEQEIAAARALDAEIERKNEEIREEASRRGELRNGQTYDQVRRVLGDYYRRNDYAAGRETQAIYRRSNGEIYYVYYTDGRVTSWQRMDPR